MGNFVITKVTICSGSCCSVCCDLGYVTGVCVASATAALLNRWILIDITDGGYLPLQIVPMLVGGQGINLNVVLDIRTKFKKNKIQV